MKSIRSTRPFFGGFFVLFKSDCREPCNFNKVPQAARQSKTVVFIKSRLRHYHARFELIKCNQMTKLKLLLLLLRSVTCGDIDHTDRINYIIVHLSWQRMLKIPSITQYNCITFTKRADFFFSIYSTLI